MFLEISQNSQENTCARVPFFGLYACFFRSCTVASPTFTTKTWKHWNKWEHSVWKWVTRFFKYEKKKETLTQVFSFEFCVIYKNTSLTERLWVTACNDLVVTFIILLKKPLYSLFMDMVQLCQLVTFNH